MAETIGAVHTHTHTRIHLLIDKKINKIKHREIYLCSFEIERI